MSIAPTGVIEFVPKSDPMVELLLRNRPDIFPDYSQEQFLACIRQRARIIDQEQLSPGGRLLIWYEAPV